MAESQTWQEIAARKQEERSSRIPKEWRLSEATISAAASSDSVLDVPRKSGLLSAQELEITETKDATKLLEELLTKRRSSVDVVTAFCKRAAIAQQVVSPTSRFDPFYASGDPIPARQTCRTTELAYI